jgi:2,4-dienoyl-CoA reductase-like NADH-dependent reductase (Old Yellow Enzyme family)
MQYSTRSGRLNDHQVMSWRDEHVARQQSANRLHAAGKPVSPQLFAAVLPSRDSRARWRCIMAVVATSRIARTGKRSRKKTAHGRSSNPSVIHIRNADSGSTIRFPLLFRFRGVIVR